MSPLEDIISNHIYGSILYIFTVGNLRLFCLLNNPGRIRKKEARNEEKQRVQMEIKNKRGRGKRKWKKLGSYKTRTEEMRERREREM